MTIEFAGMQWEKLMDGVYKCLDFKVVDLDTLMFNDVYADKIYYCELVKKSNDINKYRPVYMCDTDDSSNALRDKLGYTKNGVYQYRCVVSSPSGGGVSMSSVFTDDSCV